MYNVGDLVRVLPPFNETFNGEYAITEVVNGEDGPTTYILGGNGGFDALYLEAA